MESRRVRMSLLADSSHIALPLGRIPSSWKNKISPNIEAELLNYSKHMFVRVAEAKKCVRGFSKRELPAHVLCIFYSMLNDDYF